ncbi:phospholipase D-like domain-containing protein [Pseudomonas aeruginosa]|uniref:phospholipase D-like domain-containing protein n=1 Tax=Pseudomonas aeruginosa TaxID=287 RepID=UPI00371CA61F
MADSSIFTNSPGQDQVLRPFQRLISTASHIRLAAPYFTRPGEILEAAERGAKIDLLVGLNPATNPAALRQALEADNCSIRYFTDGFHAKIFLFDGVAMLGSANLTDGGLVSNREAVVLLDQPGDEERIRDLEALFAVLWDSAEVLTRQVYLKFKDAWEKASRMDSRDTPFQSLADVEPPTVLAGSGHKTAQQHYLSDLRKTIYEQYLPAFEEVAAILREQGTRRPEFNGLAWGPEVNRYLNWVRLEHAPGDAAWQDAPIRRPQDRRTQIQTLVMEWLSTATPRIPEDYFELLETLHAVMESPESIRASSKEQIAAALMCVHAFSEQLRFTLGGAEALPAKFWEGNREDLGRVLDTLIYLIHGHEEFAARIGSVLYDPKYKLASFGRFCALELVGTLKPEQVPPINGRMAKALRFLGFDVRAT